MNAARTLPWDWYDGSIPENVRLHESAYLETTYSFHLYRTQQKEGLIIEEGASVYTGTMFNVGPHGKVRIGAYSLLKPAWLICDEEIDIGPYCLISWNVVLMDTYRLPKDPRLRRPELRAVARRSVRELQPAVPAGPIRLEPNVWIGFDACVLPGVTIGQGSVVGARSVVASNVPPFTVVAGNPARVIRKFTKEEILHASAPRPAD